MGCVGAEVRLAGVSPYKPLGPRTPGIACWQQFRIMPMPRCSPHTVSGDRSLRHADRGLLPAPSTRSGGGSQAGCWAVRPGSAGPRLPTRLQAILATHGSVACGGEATDRHQGNGAEPLRRDPCSEVCATIQPRPLPTPQDTAMKPRSLWAKLRLTGKQGSAREGHRCMACCQSSRTK